VGADTERRAQQQRVQKILVQAVAVVLPILAATAAQAAQEL